MSMIDVTLLGAAAVTQPAAQQSRAVSDAAAQQFREALAKPDCAGEACSLQSIAPGSASSALDLDLEKAIVHMPSANASPAEVAMGLLRVQVEVSQKAVAIELLSRTTQSLSQGVQSLTTRS
jgi:hypothetical protein